jgi:hypothetical protein
MDKNKKIIPDNTWVKVKWGNFTSNNVRFVTRKMTDNFFEDDGKLSLQEPSKYCNYDLYEPISENELTHLMSGTFLKVDTLELIHETVKSTHNDADLGAKIRKIFIDKL